VKVGAYQAPLDALSSADILGLIRRQVDACESAGVEILCCPEAVLGGLADYATDRHAIAIDVQSGQLGEILAPLASDTVTTIVGFTEIESGQLHNSAAVFSRGAVAGIYRKHHPAINRSIYAPGERAPVFTVNGLTFGIIICRDSSFDEPATSMMCQGATALFVPTNNGLSSIKGGPDVAAEARCSDIARATIDRVVVVRADVAGRSGGLVSYGSTAIVDATGVVLASAEPLVPDLIVADIDRRKERGT
jgi:predicted amidohydrolase